MKKLLLVVAAVLLVACSPRYQIVSSRSSSDVLKLDTRTGDTWLFDGEHWKPVK